MFIDKLVNTVSESFRAAVARAEQQRAAKRERMSPYLCGYDVYPEGDGREYANKIISGLVVRAGSCWLLLAGACGAAVFYRHELSKMPTLLFLGAIPMLVLFFVGLGAVRLLARFLTGCWDVFGGVCTDKRVESETTTDTDGSTSTTYTYFVSLNGIESRVPNKQYNTAMEERYYRFVRVRMRYISDDRLYLFPCDISERERRIGQHYPAQEPRLVRAANRGCLSAFVAGSFAVGAVALAALGYYEGKGLLPDFIEKYHRALAAACGGLFLLSLTVNQVRGRALEKRLIEEKMRQYDRN